ncbi:MAG TPA: hypothetical protein VHF26_03645 [Trebonia sp.]|nr:hypothetical protein [Trebonia sp.]
MSAIASSASVAVVDVANVMGARADGWWRDRAAAALRLCREVMTLAQRPDSPAATWVLVLEGQARDAVPMLSGNALPDAAAPPGDDWVPPPDQALPVRVVAAPGSGDDAIVGVVAEAVAAQEEEESVLVVTADRELRARCEELNASVVGPGWLLRLIEPGGR